MLNVTASAYIADKRLHVLGVAFTPAGVVPFEWSSAADESDSDGPVNVHGELAEGIADSLAEGKAQIMQGVQTEALKSAAESLVKRARNGDENAIGMICMVRQRSSVSPRAQATMQYLAEYIKTHPVSQDDGKPLFAGDKTIQVADALRKVLVNTAEPTRYAALLTSFVPHTTGHCATTILADGPEIGAEQVDAVLQRLPADALRKAFRAGMTARSCPRKVLGLRKRLRRPGQKALDLGFFLGRAKAIQDVRKPDSKLSDFHPGIGWELGDE